ncbi:MAG: hypothetical protein L0241_06205 [Planctomycetia bacterium]|nr:hypothetical protein [Planctomycetia bacterium]
MGVLTEYVRNEAEQLKKEAHRREEAVKEWLAAVEKLYDQLEGWLRDADSGLGILKCSRMIQEQVREPRLGSYYVSPLGVSLGVILIDRSAVIVPRSRYVSFVIQPPGREPRRADGLVEIHDRYRNQSAFPEYYLFRSKTDGGDEWFIRSVNAWNADPNDIAVEPLDREGFEAAMLRVLQ